MKIGVSVKGWGLGIGVEGLGLASSIGGSVFKVRGFGFREVGVGLSVGSGEQALS